MSVRKAVVGSERVLLGQDGWVYRAEERNWVPEFSFSQPVVPVSEPIERWVDVGRTWLGHAAWFPMQRRGGA